MSQAASSSGATGNREWDQWEHRFAPVGDGLQLHFVDVGPRDAMPVVLVHGWPDLWFAWRHQIGPLSKTYRVIVPDLRGYGRSSAPADIEAYGSKNLTGDLAELLDFLNLPRAVFVGHDWGGAIVWCMCLYHPSRVLAVCGVCTPYFPQPDQCVDTATLIQAFPQFSYMRFLSQSGAAAKALDSAPRRMFTATFRLPEEHKVDGVSVPFLEILEGVAGAAGGDDEGMSWYTQRSEIITEQELDYYVQEYSHSGFKGSCNYYAVRVLDFETENPLPRVIPHKALYIGASADPVLKPEMAANMPPFVPNLETALVEGGGHWLLWSHKHEVSEILTKWLAKVEDVSDIAAP